MYITNVQSYYKSHIAWAEELAQIYSTGYSPRGQEFNAQQIHGSLQLTIMRSDALFWYAGKHADRTLGT